MATAALARLALTPAAIIIAILASFFVICPVSGQQDNAPAIDHVRVVIVVDNSTSSTPRWRYTSSNLEAAAKFFTFYDRKLIANHTRYVVSVVKIPVFDDPLTAVNLLCRRIQKETNLVGMILTDATPTFRSFIGEVSQFTAIPVIELFTVSSMAMMPVPSHFHFYMCDFLIPVVQEVIAVYRWPNMLLLYDSPHNLACVNQLLGNPKQSLHVLALGVNDDNIYEVVAMIKVRWTSVVVAFERNRTLRFLHLALRLGILNPEYTFIFTNPDVHMSTMEEFAHNQPNVTFFRFIGQTNFSVEVVAKARQFEQMQPRYKVLVPKSPPHEGLRSVLLYDQEVQIPLSSAMLFDALLLLRSVMEKLLSTSKLLPWSQDADGVACSKLSLTSQGREVTNALLEHSLTGLTGQVQFNKTTRIRDTFVVEVLGLGNAGLRKVGSYFSEALEAHDRTPGVSHELHLESDIHNLLQVSQTLRPNRNSSEKEKKVILRVTTLLEKPYVMILRDKSKKQQLGGARSRSVHEHHFEGYCIDLLEEIATLANFYYSIHLVRDGRYGSFNASSGKWSGMIGEVVEGVASMAVAPLTITYAREQVVDFTKPFINLGISILYVQPFKTSPGMFSFMQPLAANVWVAVSVAFLAVSIVFYVLGHFVDCAYFGLPEGAPGGPKKPPTRQSKIFTLFNSIFFTTGGLVKMGSSVVPQTIPTRVISCAWWFFAMIIISSYTANLAAFLTVETLVSPFENAEELAQQSKVMYGAVKGGATENFFRESKIETYQKMWTFMKDKDVFTRNNSEGIDRVRKFKGGYAYLMESVSMDYIIANDNKDCQLRQVGGLLDSKGYGIAMAKDSPFRDSLSMAILQLQENDRLQLLYDKWWKFSGSSCQPEKDGAKVLGIQNVFGVFVILAIGLSLSAFALFVELLWYHRKRHHPYDKRSYCARVFESLRMPFLSASKRQALLMARTSKGASSTFVDNSEQWRMKRVRESSEKSSSSVIHRHPVRVSRTPDAKERQRHVMRPLTKTTPHHHAQHHAQQQQQKQQKQQKQKQQEEPQKGDVTEHRRSSSLTLRRRTPSPNLPASGSDFGPTSENSKVYWNYDWKRSNSYKEISV